MNTNQKVIVRPDLRDVRSMNVLLPDPKQYIRAAMVKPVEFTGITLDDWFLFQDANKCDQDYERFDAELIRESNRKRREAEARVKAKRRHAKTVLATRGLISQNERFRELAKTHNDKDNAQPQRPRAGEGIDLSKLEPTARYVYKPRPPYT